MKLFFILLAFSGAVLAHQNTVTDSGKVMFLAAPELGLELKNNPTYIPLSQTRSIVQEVLNQWNAPQTRLNLSLTNSNPNFQIRFENDFSRYGSGVVGITEINYNRDGVIQKAIVKLNNNVLLSDQKAAHRMGGVYLGDVLSHEVGHLIGLGHSEVLESTMYFESFSGQHSIARDDVAGVRTLYSSGHGRISGKVMGGNEVPVLGAQVKAISRLTGEAISTVSDEEGRFNISGLDLNDSYVLYVSPTQKINDLPPYYANTQSNFCPGQYKGGFFTACGVEESGNAQIIYLSPNKKVVDVGVVSISCSLRSSPEYARSKVEDVDSVLIWDSFLEGVSEKNHIGYFSRNESWTNWDRLRVDLRNIPSSGASKTLRMNLVNYPFGNLLEYQVKIFKDDVEIQTLGISENLLTRTYQNNISWTLPLSSVSSENDFQIHIRARSLPLTSDCIVGNCARWTFPAVNLLALNDQSPYLLVMGLEEWGNPLFNSEQKLSDNLSCLEGPFTYAVERNVAHSEESATQQTQETMSCGTIEPPSNSSPPQQGLFSLCLGFMLACLSWLLKKDKKTLS